MTGLKTSIYIDPDTLDALAARGAVGSATIRRVVAWYAEVVRRERPDLNDDEWADVRGALAGRLRGPIGPLASGLPGEVAVHLRGARSDVRALVAKLHALSFAGRVAVLDDVLTREGAQA